MVREATTDAIHWKNQSGSYEGVMGLFQNLPTSIEPPPIFGQVFVCPLSKNEVRTQ